MMPGRIIIVLGVRRSGTSAITKGLETMGVSIVDQAATPFNTFNEKGYWEDLEIHDFNMRLHHALTPLEQRWRGILPLSQKETDFLCGQGFLEQACVLLRSKLSKASQPLAFKDPRFSILLPFWKRVFKKSHVPISYVIALRNPDSTVASMKALGSFSEQDNNHAEKFLWTWLAGLIGILEVCWDEDCVLVDYEELLKQPAFQMQRVADALKLRLREDLLKIYCDDFIDQSLCHFYQQNEGIRSDQLWAAEVYKQFFGAARDQFSFAQLKSLGEEWSARLSLAEPLLVLAEKNEQSILMLRAAQKNK